MSFLFTFSWSIGSYSREAYFCSSLFSLEQRIPVFEPIEGVQFFRNEEADGSSFFMLAGELGKNSSNDEDEMHGVRNTAKFFRKKHTDLLFVPSFRGYSVPAFDGVQINHQGRIIANVQIKSMRVGNPAKRIKDAILKIDKFAHNKEMWTHVVGALHGEAAKRTAASDAAMLINLFDIGPESKRENVIIIIYPHVDNLRKDDLKMTDLQSLIDVAKRVHRVILHDGNSTSIEFRNERLLLGLNQSESSDPSEN